MAILGFDALGKLALGQLPSPPLPLNPSQQAPPTSLRKSTAAIVLGSSMVLLTTVPFIQSDWAPAKPIRPAAVDQQQYNSKLYTNDIPFLSTTEFRGSINVRLAAPPDQIHTNIGNFTNPIPFGPFDYNKARAIPREPQPPQGMALFNPNLYTNNIPFGPFDWSKTARQKPQPDHAPYNLALLTQTVAAPFALKDFGKTFAPTSAPPQLLSRNLSRNPLIFSEVPFSQSDWSVQRRVADFLPPDRSYNGLIYSEVPFGQKDWAAPTKPKTLSDLASYNLALLGVQVTAPFYQLDWSKPRSVTSLAPDQAHTDINKFTNPLPFAQLDWSKPQRSQGALYPAPQPYNANFYTNPIPFAQFDWSKTSRVAGVPGAPLPLNLSLSIVVQSPFYQTDWAVTVRSKTAAVDQIARNVLILSEVPFSQTDWPKSFDIVGLPPGSGPLNVNLFTNPYPFAQYDWSKPQRSPNWQGAKSGDFNLSLSSAPVAPPFVQLDWSKPVNVAPVRPEQAAPNIALLVTPPAPAPFYQLDWSKPVQLAGLLPAPLPLNFGLYPPPEAPVTTTGGGGQRYDNYTPFRIYSRKELARLRREEREREARQEALTAIPIGLSQIPLGLAEAPLGLAQLSIAQQKPGIGLVTAVIAQMVAKEKADAIQREIDDDEASMLLL